VSRKLSAADIFDTVEVDLWGNAYTLRTITKSVAGKLTHAQLSVQALDPETQDENELARLMIELIDLLLEPAENTKAAVDVLVPLWDEDKLGLDWLTAFSRSLQEEAEARRRPTSPTPTNT
jgi:hypothetical protein